MQHERVTDDIYVFTSEVYAQVTAGIIVTDAGVVVLDTLVYPEETLQIRRFVEERLQKEICYVINSHYHADHTTGTCFFESAQIIGHTKCREFLDVRGRESLERAQINSANLDDVQLVLPTITFDQELTLYLGNKTLQLRSMPGHSPDSITCFVEEDQVLFAADMLMPIPYFVDGDYGDFLTSLHTLKSESYEHVVQGHGEVILKGEVREKIDNDIKYLQKLKLQVERVLDDGYNEHSLSAITIESCGKSRVLLNGMAQQLHHQNVIKLAEVGRESESLAVEDERNSVEGKDEKGL